MECNQEKEQEQQVNVNGESQLGFEHRTLNKRIGNAITLANMALLNEGLPMYSEVMETLMAMHRNLATVAEIDSPEDLEAVQESFNRIMERAENIINTFSTRAF